MLAASPVQRIEAMPQLNTVLHVVLRVRLAVTLSMPHDLSMSSWTIYCTACENEIPSEYRGFRCKCGGPLDIRFQPEMKIDDLRSDGTLWRYRQAIPIEKDECIVSLGEGGTPIQEESIVGDRVFLKLEFLAPTGSFKDRGAAVLLSRLKEMGVYEILEDSSGNAGCSLAAYSAAARIRIRVLVPASIPEGKAVQIASYGATLERISGSRDEVAREALRRAEDGIYASHNYQPFFLQGTKTFAYEVFEQMDPLPDAIFIPVGNGSLLLGCFKAFQEMIALGWIEKMPHLVGVQAVSHAPIYTEVTGYRPGSGNEKTIADGIAIGQPARLVTAAHAIKASGGTALAVDDEQIRAAQRVLAHRGYLVEPTAAAALAGYRLWREKHKETEGRFLVPLTGLGLKDFASLREIVMSP